MPVIEVEPSSSEIRHLTMVQVKFSGVHIGGGIYLTANHFPSPGGAGSAIGQRGLDDESDPHPTTEHDFTMPDDTSLWPDYREDDGDPETNDPVMTGYDIAMHVDDREDWYDGPVAPMLIMADGGDLLGGEATITGYPASPPDGGGSRAVPYETTGTLAQHIGYDVNGDPGGAWQIRDAEVLNGMSGGGTWTSYVTPDGTGGDYLIGTLSSSYDSGDPTAPGALSADLSQQYDELAASIQALDSGRTADDFARNVLMTGQSAGTSANDVTGTFFHEDIWGNANDNLLSGAGGDDRLYGMAGNNALDGGTGDDTLIAGSGNDSLTGGEGADVFAGFGAGGMSRILDFDGVDDVLDLSDIFADLAELRAAATQADDGSLVIDLSQGTAGSASGTLVIEGADLDSLTPGNTMILCFGAETRIQTPAGSRPAGDLRKGDLVLTLDHGAVPLIWVGRQNVTARHAEAVPGKQAISIEAGALGPDLPVRAIELSPQHRVLVAGPVVRRMTGCVQAFVRAGDLVGCPGVTRSSKSIAWIHLLCEQHEILSAEGLPAESLFPGPMALSAADGDLDATLLDFDQDPEPCRNVLSRRRAQTLLGRHLRNGRSPVSSFSELCRYGPHALASGFPGPENGSRPGSHCIEGAP